jgi:hypothetical protein
MLHTASVMVAAFVTVPPLAAYGQSVAEVPLPLPFAIGERLTYRVRLSALGSVGTSVMWIEGPVDVRGVPTILLRSSFEAGKGFIRASGTSDSWYDAAAGTALRFDKREARPFNTLHERVEMFPAEQRWENIAGMTGESITAMPLDELSFIYYIRTLNLCADSSYSINRHYDAAKNPVLIRVLRREIVTTGAGAFPTIVVEMRVRDASRFKDGAVITLFLSDDARRLPVRIEAPAPMFGTATFTLESYSK